MSHHNLLTSDIPEMDDAASMDTPLSNPAGPTRASTTTSGRGRGRGRWARVKNARVTKTAQPRASAGRGRRQKVYDSLKIQAAHERAQELKQAFAAVGKLVKPAVQEIADRSINELLEDPAAFEMVPEYATTKTFLRKRRDDTIKLEDVRLKHRLAMIEHVYKAECQKAHEAYTTKLAELCEDRYGQLLQQLDILEYLFNNRLPVDLPALPDDRYLFREITEEDAKWQGVFYQTRDGIEVPHSGETISQLMVKPQTLPLEALKRKADGQPDGQPAPKAAAVAKDDDAVAPMPRHTAGLLGAVEAIEESAATTPDSGSNAPTPTPAAEPAEEAAADRARQHAATGSETPADGPDLPIPRGATAPDEYGVRLISRRATRMDLPNNRVMLPNLFEWDDLDIGFRDSTNCAQKGATKQRRGKYLGRPGSNFMFVDRRAGIWDSTLAEGELDEELVKKHNLHPAYGLALPNSVNEWEPPKPVVSGWKPVVFVAPNGDTFHSSRTIESARIDAETDAVETRMKVAHLVRTFCEQEGIPEEEVAPDRELVQRKRAEVLAARGIDPAQLSEPEPSPPAAPSPAAAEPPAAGDAAGLAQFADAVLSAAAVVDAEEEAARMAAPKRAQASRPYDAIRDVFTDSPPTRHPSSPAPAAVDTSSLSCLADAALQPEPPIVARPEPPRTNDFLRTALNTEPPAFQPAMPAPPPGPPLPPPPPPAPAPAPTAAPGPILAQAPQPASGRTPFSNPGTAKALPALRPMRSLLSEPPSLTEPQGSTALLHGTMVTSNSGAYFPPAASRPYHNSYSLQESSARPMQPVMPQQLLGNPLQAPPLAAAPMGSAPPRRMSPYPVSPLLTIRTLSLHRSSATSAALPPASSKYRKLEPAPTPPHRLSYSGNGQELRTVQFDYREAIKDYTPVEAPPRSGPTQIRGWTHNNIKKAAPRPTSSSSKGDAGGIAVPGAGASSDEPSA
ncbi:40281ab5-a5a7-4de7-bd3a-540db465727c [Thermothielavioides terrestris]|uniref:40281ab5-a5a7-4de7-bd3a-540db465727c n=1 Tax=Thermothielavioides terrestris TaxID=2587410 RepID=A0A446BK56_9PEZI|nr:40281ab5-a5a7-4de7-bd3a-540db465727c [Thermothielavioides terrestris]